MTSTLTMYDGVNAAEVPAGAGAYMGYLNGAWPTYLPLKAMHPHARHVSVTVTASVVEGDVLDVENGDATPQQAPGWIVARRAQGAHWAAVYTSESNWPLVQDAFATAKVAQPFYGIAWVPGPGAVLIPGSVFHQYLFASGYDASVADVSWLDLIPGNAPVKPQPDPHSPASTLGVAARPDGPLPLLVPGTATPHDWDVYGRKLGRVIGLWSRLRPVGLGDYGSRTQDLCVESKTHYGIPLDGTKGDREWGARLWNAYGVR